LKRIAIYNAKPDMVIAKEIYGRNGRLLLNKGTVLTQKWIDKLYLYGVPTVYIEPERNLSEPVRGIEVLTPGRELTTDRRCREDLPDIVPHIIREEAEQAVREIMQDIKAGSLFKTKKARAIIEKIINQLIKNRHIAGKLADIRILDDYTFSHSVNVCIFAISTGIFMGYSKIRLRELGIGALLHDVGKMKIPEAILQKCGPLTEREFEQIKKHTVLGYQLLSDNREITPNAALIALQHHECYNGSGYPRGIDNKDIHEYSKIVAIADVYDALTADRVYKNSILPYEAMEIIIASGGYQFNPKITRLFVEHCEIYPVGSTVELNTGEYGIITDVNRALPTRPTVKIIKDAQGNEIDNGAEINLMEKPTVFVNTIISFRRMPCL